MFTRSIAVASILLLPFAAAAQPPAAPKASPSPIEERAVHFPSDGLDVPGTLTLPREHKDRLAIVVLVGGSGVQDRDETVGPNKPFADIALGLAQRGIATLRYDRRAKFALQSFLAHPDLDHEVTIDAVSALAFCSTLPEADPHRIFFLGHSLGAELAPDIVKTRLAQTPNSVRGMILLAGVARPIDVVMVEQIRTLGKAQGGTPEQIDAIASAWNNVFVKAKNPATPATEPLGVGAKLPAGYWLDWMSRDPVAAMATLHTPALVLHGSHDVNSTEADYALLARAAASASAESDAVDFSGLNHLFMPTDAMSNGADVMVPGHVAPTVIDRIAGWIAKQP